MKFNKITRGAKRAVYDEQVVYDILDAGFLCHIAFVVNGQTMMIPTAYGRSGDYLYLHGSTKNFMLNAILDGQSICVSATHLDGIVLAKTLFDTSVNYRSVVLYGKAELVTDEEERMFGLKVFTDQVIKDRWEEVSIGNENQLNATMVVKFKIESAAAKVRNEGPKGDEMNADVVWSGHIPLKTIALEPIQDMKFGKKMLPSKSVKQYWENLRQ